MFNARMRAGLIVALVFMGVFHLSGCSSLQKPKNQDEFLNVHLGTPDDARMNTRKKLLENGFTEKFIDRIEKSLSRKREWQNESQKLIELNLFGFLYHGDYQAHFSKEAVKKIKRYLRAHQYSFDLASKKYHVSAEAIASLLWVETKLGKVTGSFSLPETYFSIAMASEPYYCQTLLAQLEKRLSQSPYATTLSYPEAKTKLMSRCQTKADWAISELKAVQDIEQMGAFDPFKMKCSFAGAFGIPQFIPSSYLKHSASRYRRRANLSMISDSIMSVAKFLHTFGWDDHNEQLQSDALFAYNRSKDYGAVILRLKKEVEKK